MPTMRPGATHPAFTPGDVPLRITNPQAEASEKQLTFLLSLAMQRDIGMSRADFQVMYDCWRDAGLLTKGFVSEQIEEYKTKPKREVKTVEPGYYTKDGEFFCVVWNKAKTYTYAKRLLVSKEGFVKWEYQRGAVSQLGDLTPLTFEEAAKWGHLHGKCIICLRPLTDVDSVRDGIGPVCRKKVK